MMTGVAAAIHRPWRVKEDASGVEPGRRRTVGGWQSTEVYDA